MNMWRVGEDMGSKETDRCPLTDIGFLYYAMSTLQVRSLCVFTKAMKRCAYENKEKGNKGK
jgi:hypothetical protein